MLKELKDNSIQIHGTVVVCWPQYGDKQSVTDMRSIAVRFNDCYAVNNSVICFVNNNEVFVTPYTREAITVVEESGLIERHFYVPFSNWDYPKFEARRWQRLQMEADEARYRYYEEDAIKWCDQHFIGILSDEVLDRCLRIPCEGMIVKDAGRVKIIGPLCGELSVDTTVTEKLGRYNTNNGVVAFVYRDGHTYLANGYWILKDLHHSGYRKAALFVPLSNGEKITDPHLAEEWARKSEAARQATRK
ncbi:hypothetical protein IKE72_00500 [Candidatus Saccharibacteria bacterium]|nr:hypothetical protein [Candidatus Saccharibacteria bacterium]